MNMYFFLQYMFVMALFIQSKKCWVVLTQFWGQILKNAINTFKPTAGFVRI